MILKPRLQLIRRTGPDLSDVTPSCGNVRRYNRAHRDLWDVIVTSVSGTAIHVHHFGIFNRSIKLVLWRD